VITILCPPFDDPVEGAIVNTYAEIVVGTKVSFKGIKPLLTSFTFGK